MKQCSRCRVSWVVSPLYISSSYLSVHLLLFNSLSSKFPWFIPTVHATNHTVCRNKTGNPVTSLCAKRPIFKKFGYRTKIRLYKEYGPLQIYVIQRYNSHGMVLICSRTFASESSRKCKVFWLYSDLARDNKVSICALYQGQRARTRFAWIAARLVSSREKRGS